MTTTKMQCRECGTPLRAKRRRLVGADDWAPEQITPPEDPI